MIYYFPGNRHIRLSFQHWFILVCDINDLIPLFLHFWCLYILCSTASWSVWAAPCAGIITQRAECSPGLNPLIWDKWPDEVLMCRRSRPAAEQEAQSSREGSFQHCYSAVPLQVPACTRTHAHTVCFSCFCVHVLSLYFLKVFMCKCIFTACAGYITCFKVLNIFHLNLVSAFRLMRVLKSFNLVFLYTIFIFILSVGSIWNKWVWCTFVFSSFSRNRKNSSAQSVFFTCTFSMFAYACVCVSLGSSPRG